MKRFWMMWTLCWLLVAALFVPALAEGNNAAGTTMYVVNCNDWVSLRSSPSTSASRVTTIPLGAEVQNCEPASSTFTHCTYNGMSGYVLTEYLSVHAPSAGGDNYIGEMRVVNCNDWVSLRSRPSTSSSRITTVPLGAVLMECTRYSSEFVYGNYNGQWGYVLSDYLSRVPDQVAEGQGYVGDMIVVNCDEWVSLREEPSTSASRITKVPLGATVQNCTWYSSNFICCDYNGLTGYILASYLQAVGGDADVDVQMSVSGEKTGYGRLILEHTIGELTVFVYHDFGAESEKLYIECLNAQGSQAWNHSVVVPFVTELQGADAFIGGTEQEPLVIVYNAGEGVYALDFFGGQQKWMVPNATVNFGGGISYAVDAAGTAYIGGYYGPDPVAIDVNGQVLWKAISGHDAYWMYKIELTAAGIVATYDCIDEHEAAGEITYGFDGTVLDVVWF